MASDPIVPSKIPAPGWVGGFSTSNPAFAYPHPDLSSLPMLGNMDNIPLLQRQLDVLWPEFSWQTVIGEEKSRCYQMFAPDISRAGYTAQGRIYSIICPQQGSYSPTLGDLNIEVTVTGNRGWVDEPPGRRITPSAPCRRTSRAGRASPGPTREGPARSWPGSPGRAWRRR